MWFNSVLYRLFICVNHSYAVKIYVENKFMLQLTPLLFLFYLFMALFISFSSYSTVSQDAGIKPRIWATI